ncbi:AbrB family transcriptional regulator [Thioploca ingrica]|uniref:AbrB family transcriptional regulator n=1 Tax=Thioploca ingrica TaxID=40754 RepID=A0A090AH97_9GAMM|nr:AbrB family transcriptional regulator [Thioploca ingrica]
MTSSISLQLDAQGQLILPLAVQQALGIKAGDILLAHLENDRLILEKNTVVKQKLKSRFKHLDSLSLADELIQTRRHEAIQENR